MYPKHLSQKVGISDVLLFPGKLLSVLLNGLSDRNMGVRKSFAATIGYIVRVSTQTGIVRQLLISGTHF